MMPGAGLPTLPALELLEAQGRTIVSPCGRFQLAYDLESATGLIYEVSLARWNITSPVSFQDFAALLLIMGYGLPATEATKRWVERCCHLFVYQVH